MPRMKYLFCKHSVLREECKRNRLKMKVGKRPAKFKDKRRREECRILTECWREKKKKDGEGENSYLFYEFVCKLGFLV
jgi:hypothetical protein